SCCSCCRDERSCEGSGCAVWESCWIRYRSVGVGRVAGVRVREGDGCSRCSSCDRLSGCSEEEFVERDTRGLGQRRGLCGVLRLELLLVIEVADVVRAQDVLQLSGRGRLPDYRILALLEILRKNDGLGYLQRLLECERSEGSRVGGGNLERCVLHHRHSLGHKRINSGRNRYVHLFLSQYSGNEKQCGGERRAHFL
ncbi:hypothetical protein PFISCL1PPCAC_4638, partial [Pristionchus fissidentatus]